MLIFLFAFNSKLANMLARGFPTNCLDELSIDASHMLEVVVIETQNYPCKASQYLKTEVITCYMIKEVSLVQKVSPVQFYCALDG